MGKVRNYDVLLVTENERLIKSFYSGINTGGVFEVGMDPKAAREKYQKYSAVMIDVDSLESYRLGREIAEEGSMPVVYLFTEMSSDISDHVAYSGKHESWVMNNGQIFHIARHLVYACDSFYLEKKVEGLQPVPTIGDLYKREKGETVVIKSECSSGNDFYGSLIGHEGSLSDYYEHVVGEVSKFLHTDKVCLFVKSNKESNKWEIDSYTGFKDTDVSVLFGCDAYSPIGVVLSNLNVLSRDKISETSLSGIGQFELSRNLAGVEVFVPCISPRFGVVAIIALGVRLNGEKYTQKDINSLCSIARVVGTEIVEIKRHYKSESLNVLMGNTISSAPIGILITSTDKVALYNNEFKNMAGLLDFLIHCDDIPVKSLGSKVSNVVLSDITSEEFNGTTYNIARKKMSRDFTSFYFVPSHKPSKN